MHRLTLVVLLSGVLFSGCARRIATPDEVVDQTYIHRYGVPVAKEDWASHGESGQVKTTMKNGVVMTQSFAHGELDGETSYTFAHSDLIDRVETYEAGTLVKETKYYRNGTPKEQTVFKSPSTSQIYTWYENGAPRSSETQEHGLLLTGEYFTLTHSPDSRVDNQEGVRTRRDPFGHLIGADTVALGVVTLTKTYHPNGAIKQETPFVEKQISGQVKNYLPDGQPSSMETWANGEKTGVTITFENGEKIAEVPYVRGVKDGIEKRFRNGDTVVEEISWIQDSRHGPSKAMIGGVTKTDYYYQGKLVTKSVFDKMTNGITPNSSAR